jgi:hypothetical protein
MLAMTLDSNMPSHGSLVLSDLAARYLKLVREPRERQGSLDIPRIFDKRVDTQFIDHMPTVVNRDKARAFSLYDRCKARYGLCP